MKDGIDSNKAKQSLIVHSIYFYRKMPYIFVTYNCKKFKRECIFYVEETFPNNSVPRNENK